MHVYSTPFVEVSPPTNCSCPPVITPSTLALINAVIAAGWISSCVLIVMTSSSTYSHRLVDFAYCARLTL